MIGIGRKYWCKLLLVSVLLWPLGVMAKGDKELIRANYYYAHGLYAEAAKSYEQVPEDQRTVEVLTKWAHSYNASGALAQAAACYAKATATAGCATQVYLQYGQLLMKLQAYDSAAAQLKKYRASVKVDRRVDNLIAGCAQAQTYMRQLPTGTEALLPLNTSGSEFAPTMWNKRLVFAADTVVNAQKKQQKTTGKAYYSLYAVDCANEGLCTAAWYAISEGKAGASKYHNGPSTFSKDGATMYYTRSMIKDGWMKQKALVNSDTEVVLEIMIATDFDSATQCFKTITAYPHNNKEYSVAHPSVSPNGKVMALVSNMPKGQGQSDIYLSKKMGKTWGRLVNAGAILNTEGQELFPFWISDNKLCFSSDGHAGVGGLDIYCSEWDEQKNTFSKPRLLPLPVNSAYDDISLAITHDEKAIWLSSDRPAEVGGDNVYYFRKQQQFLELKVMNKNSEQVVSNAKVELRCNDSVLQVYTDATGVGFVGMYPGKKHAVQVVAEGYWDQTVQVEHLSNTEYDTIRETVYMLPKERQKEAVPQIDLSLQVVRNRNVMDTPGIRNFEQGAVYEVGAFKYEYNKWELSKAHQPFLDTLYAQLTRNPTMHIEVQGHTDCRGSAKFNLELSKKRAYAVVEYMVKQGIARNRLTYVGMGDTKPKVPCPKCDECSEDQHALNRIMEIKVLRL